MDCENNYLNRKLNEIKQRAKNNCCNIPFIIPQGPRGPQGPTGPQGEPGEAGPQGEPGEAGTSPTITPLAGGASPVSAHLVITQIS